MPFNNFFANGKPHAGSLILAAFAVEPLKRCENLLGKLLIEAYSVVFYDDLATAIICRGAENPYHGFLATFMKLESISDQVLK